MAEINTTIKKQEMHSLHNDTQTLINKFSLPACSLSNPVVNRQLLLTTDNMLLQLYSFHRTSSYTLTEHKL